MFLMVLAESQSKDVAANHEVGLIAVDTISQHCNIDGLQLGVSNDNYKHMHILLTTVIDFTFADKVITRPYPKYRTRTVSTYRVHCALRNSLCS